MKLFFDINKTIYKHNKDGSLTKVLDVEECNGGTCLVMNTSKSIEDKNLYTNVFDSDVKTDFIKKELKLELESYVYSTLIEDDKTFVFGITKDYFTMLIDSCGFNKVYPMEYFLYKMGEGRNGIVAEDILLLKPYADESCFRSDYLSGSQDTVYYVNLNVDIYIKNLERLQEDSIDINLAIFSNKINETMETLGNINIDSFIQLINEYQDFYIVDNISTRYRKKILHKYMAIGDVVFLGIIATIVFFYLKNISQESYYNSEIETQSNQISKFTTLNNKTKSELPKMKFDSFPLEASKNILVPFTSYNPIKFKYEFDIKKKNIRIFMMVNGIKNVENLVGYLKSKKYKFSYIKKNGYNFEFKIIVKIRG